MVCNVTEIEKIAFDSKHSSFEQLNSHAQFAQLEFLILFTRVHTQRVYKRIDYINITNSIFG